MQTENYQPDGKRKMAASRFTEFQTFSVDLRVGIFLSASLTDDWLFFLPIIWKLAASSKRHLEFCITARKKRL